jgi:hypothetical protein
MSVTKAGSVFPFGAWAAHLTTGSGIDDAVPSVPKDLNATGTCISPDLLNHRDSRSADYCPLPTVLDFTALVQVDAVGSTVHPNPTRLTGLII